MTVQEGMVLRYMISRDRQVVSRQELLQEVWNLPEGTETRTVDIFIARLRKYIEPDPSRPVFIESIRGVGYRFNRDPDESE